MPPTLPPLRPVGNTAPPPIPVSGPGFPTLMMTPAKPAAPPSPASPPSPAAPPSPASPPSPAAPPSIVLAPDLDTVPDPPIIPPPADQRNESAGMTNPTWSASPPVLAPPVEAIRRATPPPQPAMAPLQPPRQPAVAPPPPPSQPFVPPTPQPGFAPYSYDDPGIPVPQVMPDGQPAPAVWRQAHPSAQRWADRRQKSDVSARGAVPSPPRMALGLLIAGIGIWLLVSFIPARRPLDAAEQTRVSQQAGVDAGAWRFSPALHGIALGGAALYLAVGLLVALRGAFFRPGAPGARRSAIALGVSFALLTVAMVVVVAVASLGGPAG
ncbi:MAG TPA: hypothetical protein VMZ28_21065 [Kofleriaceae bacterium]|nr:hypothetical protein [Kofleriaceae bacterium]